MAINLSDLPPKYQRQAVEKYMKQQKRRGPAPSAAAVQNTDRAAKYRNTPTERVTASGAVLRFDSQKEARRYDHLTLRQLPGRFYIQGAGRAAGGGGCKKQAHQNAGISDQAKADERAARN